MIWGFSPPSSNPVVIDVTLGLPLFSFINCSLRMCSCCLGLMREVVDLSIAAWITRMLRYNHFYRLDG